VKQGYFIAIWSGLSLFLICRAVGSLRVTLTQQHSLVFLFFGHLLELIRTALKHPVDTHYQVLLESLAEKYDLISPGLFYIDGYPLRDDNHLIVTSPQVATKITQRHMMKKHPTLPSVFGFVLGRRSVTIAGGAEWRALRVIFNPAFSAMNILSLMLAYVCRRGRNICFQIQHLPPARVGISHA
jgi:hypothetical protein